MPWAPQGSSGRFRTLGTHVLPTPSGQVVPHDLAEGEPRPGAALPGSPRRCPGVAAAAQPPGAGGCPGLGAEGGLRHRACAAYLGTLTEFTLSLPAGATAPVSVWACPRHLRSFTQAIGGDPKHVSTRRGSQATFLIPGGPGGDPLRRQWGLGRSLSWLPSDLPRLAPKPPALLKVGF